MIEWFGRYGLLSVNMRIMKISRNMNVRSYAYWSLMIILNGFVCVCLQLTLSYCHFRLKSITTDDGQCRTFTCFSVEDWIYVDSKRFSFPSVNLKTHTGYYLTLTLCFGLIVSLWNWMIDFVCFYLKWFKVFPNFLQ